MTNKINFIARDIYGYEVCPKPFPAFQAIPNWWKEAKPYTSGKLEMDQYTTNANFKKCTPMLDALTSGYIFPLWADVFVQQIDGIPNLTWRTDRELFTIHGYDLGVEIPDGYSKYIFKYCNMWYPKMPKGYSMLITSPFGYHNLPFKAVTGIMDSDLSPHELTPPVFLKEGFEGIVEKGTPMFQMTPIKRDDWESEFTHYSEGEYSRIENRDVLATIVNNYVKNFWQKKNYK
jgi:hypothetical protein